MGNLSRRGFLGTAGLGLAAAFNPLRGMTLPPRFFNTSDRLVIVFLRGGHDGVHTVVPVGDPTWSGPLGRQAILPAVVPLAGTSFAALNQDYRVLTTNPPNLPFTGTPPDVAGHIAWLHQVGNPQGNRSHFTEQHIYETADVKPETHLNPEGFVPRVRQRLLLANPNLPQLFGASVSYGFQRMFRSTDPDGMMAHVDVDRQGGTPSPTATRQRLALGPHLTQTNPVPDHLLAQTVRQASDFALSTQAAIANLGFTHDPLRFPANGSEAAAVGLPASAIGFRFLRDCEMAFHLASAPATACQVVGVEIGGWDTHTTQVSQRTVLDQWLAYGLRALYDLTRNLTETYTILVVSEFGRTNAVNAALGTDHGMGDLMIVMGRQANGGVYNCRPAGAGLGVASWVPIGGTFQFQNAQDVATDFRTVFWEVLRKRFLLTPADLQEIVPGYAVNVAGMPRTTELNCIN